MDGRSGRSAACMRACAIYRCICTSSFSFNAKGAADMHAWTYTGNHRVDHLNVALLGVRACKLICIYVLSSARRAYVVPPYVQQIRQPLDATRIFPTTRIDA